MIKKPSRFRIVLWTVLSIGIGYFCYRVYVLATFLKDPPPCRPSGQVIARSQAGDRVEFQPDICSGSTYSGIAMVSILSQANGSRSPILKYAELNTDPTARWIGNDFLMIKIDQVYEIYDRKSIMDGIHIQYDIGKVHKK